MQSSCAEPQILGSQSPQTSGSCNQVVPSHRIRHWFWSQISNSVARVGFRSSEKPMARAGRQIALVDTAVREARVLDWSEKPVSDLVGTELEWSTITPSTRCAGSKMKNCLFCGYAFTGGPNHIRQHLDASIRPRNVGVLSCVLSTFDLVCSIVPASRHQTGWIAMQKFS